MGGVSEPRRYYRFGTGYKKPIKTLCSVPDTESRTHRGDAAVSEMLAGEMGAEPRDGCTGRGGLNWMRGCEDEDS